MKFSIIVPVYNVEKYLSHCLDSVLNQDFDDYEIIAVDDESPDHSIDILNEYKKKTEKLKIIRQKNKGLGGARNTGIKEAKGEYLIFLDSDDYIAPKMLSSLNEYLKKDDLDILAFDCERVMETGETIERVTVKDYSDKYTSLNAKQYLLLEPTSCVKTYRRTLYTDHKIQFPEKLWYEDLATTLKLSAYAKKMGYLKEVLYYYVQQPDSITHSTNTERMMEIMPAYDGVIKFYKDNNKFQEFYEELEWNCVLHLLYYSAFRLLMAGMNIKQMKQLYQHSKKIFPNLENNKYVKMKEDNYNMMNLIMNQQYFRFYLKTGFWTKCYNLLNKVRGKS